jgi:hypothetical protein
MVMKEHDKYTERIQDYLAGNLSAEEERELLEHVESCPECKAALSDAKNFEKLMIRALAASAAPFGTPRPIKAVDIALPLTKTQSQFFRAKRSRLVRFRNVAFVSSLAAIVLLAVCLFWYSQVLNERDKALVDIAHRDVHDLMVLMRKAKKDVVKNASDDKQCVWWIPKPPREEIPYPHIDRLDPWGQPYKVVADATGVKQIYSFGPNGKDDNGLNDDILSYE